MNKNGNLYRNSSLFFFVFLFTLAKGAVEIFSSKLKIVFYLSRETQFSFIWDQ